LLTVDLDHRTTVDDLTDMLPWIDTVQFEVTGRQAFSRAVAVLTASACNHLCLVLRRPFREDNLLALLAAIPDSPCLRSLTFRWAPGMSRPGPPPAVLALTGSFFVCLRDLPVGRYLTHLGSSFLLTPSHIGVLHASGIETVLTPSRFWMHAQPATAFRYCRTPRHAPS
ncbi:MAG TPA: hypothetical protein VEL76_34825, partial [Gemmataceae bacterium]|nr:hypothetical protein [Gemmataceae bacterium]